MKMDPIVATSAPDTEAKAAIGDLLDALDRLCREELEADAEIPVLLAQIKPRWLGTALHDEKQSLLEMTASLRDRIPASGAETFLDADGSTAVIANRLSAAIQERLSLVLRRARMADERQQLAGRQEALWLRTRVDEGMRSLSEGISRIAKTHEDRIRETLLPHGRFYEQARSFAERMTQDDLSITDISDTSTLQLRDEFSGEIQQRVIRSLFAFLEEEADIVDREIAQVVHQTEGRFADLFNWNIRLQTPVYDNSRILDFAATSALNPILYSSEIPRVSGGAFVWQAFVQPAMLAGMLMMPVWILMMDLKANQVLTQGLQRSRLLLVIFSILYPGYFLYQKQKVPRDRRNRLKKELQKARNTVKGEVEKIFRTGVDEHKRALSEHWRKALDELRQQVMEAMSLAGEIRGNASGLNHRVDRLKRAADLLDQLRTRLFVTTPDPTTLSNFRPAASD